MTKTSTLTREQVLKVAQKSQAAAVRAEIDKLQLAVEWAALNPGEPVDDSIPWAERDLEIAGPGGGGRALQELAGASLQEVERRTPRGLERAVLVASVAADTPAFKYGLRAGDVILGVNGRRVGSVAALAKALRGSGRQALNIVRGDSLLSLPIR